MKSSIVKSKKNPLTGALFLMIVGSLAAFSAAGSTLSLPVLPISIEFYIQPLPVLPRL